MKVGIIGLGKMGNSIAWRAVQAGHTVFGFDLDAHSCAQARAHGISIAGSLAELAAQVRVFWLMVPPGKPVDFVLDELRPFLQAGDIVIDGGNSKFTDSIARASRLEAERIYFLDCGTSGGLAGKEIGFCLMVGGQQSIYAKILELLVAIAAPNGVAHVGPSGAGHYVKMVHNGIEYALLQAYAEGFQLLHEGSFKECGLNLQEISRLWNTSSVIRSWILQLAHEVFVQHGHDFETISGEIAQGGTGRWTVEDAHDNHVPVPVIEEALHVRAWSERTGGNYATKLVALLRNAFGGHSVKKKNHDEQMD
jgi:6-phosphogluconate dehydrogenase